MKRLQILHFFVNRFHLLKFKWPLCPIRLSHKLLIVSSGSIKTLLFLYIYCSLHAHWSLFILSTQPRGDQL